MKHISFLIIVLLSVQQAYNQGDTIRPGANLIINGIPGIPKQIAESVKRYSESRSAGFVNWHPVKRQMIITTRFGNVNQLHEVRAPLGARKQLTFFDEPIMGASFEPMKGDYFIFAKDIGGNEFSQLYRYDVRDGNITLLTDGKRSQNGGLSWSTDKKKIAYSSTRRNGADRDVYIMDPLNPSSDKLVMEAAGGGWGINDWSPDDASLLMTEYISANESYLWLYDIASGTKKELTKRTGNKIANVDGVFSKDGKGVYFITDRDNEFLRLAYMDINSGKITYLTTGIKWDVDTYSMSDDGKQIAFVTNEAGVSKLYILNTSANRYKPVNSLPTGVFATVSFHDNNNDIAVSVNNAQSPTDVFVVSASTGKAERWTESETGGIVSAELKIPELIRWNSFDGREISGFYYRPAAKFKGKRPVIINIHGGPESQSRPLFVGSSNYYLNELGVAIIFPNVRGSSGYGKTFLALDNGMKREESVKDIGALLDWIARQPDLDAERVMVAGGSYGGYMTLAVATNYNDRIRCALDLVGISNFNTFLKNTESYRRDLRRSEYGDERDPAMAAYFEKIAPLNNASKIGKPLFIVQGGNDPRVPRTEALQMAEKVKNNNTVVWYLEATDEGHGFRKKNNTDFYLYSSVYFVKNYLLDGMKEE
jgi:dipeptidyl aminopeptidase/acylaminoacyl peptidase